MSDRDELHLEAYRLIYSLHYYLEDVGTTTGRVLSCVLPMIEDLADHHPSEARALADKLLQAIECKPLESERLTEAFPDYCELIGVEWVED